ncbi:hypothetical protein EJB05_38737, partial [Eragrostis curvula]
AASFPRSCVERHISARFQKHPAARINTRTPSPLHACSAAREGQASAPFPKDNNENAANTYLSTRSSAPHTARSDQPSAAKRKSKCKPLGLLVNCVTDDARDLPEIPSRLAVLADKRAVLP